MTRSYRCTNFLVFFALLIVISACYAGDSNLEETSLANQNVAERYFAEYESAFASFEEPPNSPESEDRFLAALKSLELAAASGHSEAQLHLGYMLLTGTILPQNRESGTYWLLLSAQQGNVDAQKKLGSELILRERAPVNDEFDFKEDTRANATHWLEKAEETGDLEALWLLGIHLADCDETRERGLALLEEAAKRGYEPAREGLQLARDLTGDMLDTCTK